MKIMMLGERVKKIGKEAFKGCSSLKSITVKSRKMCSIGKEAFKGIKSNALIRVPYGKEKGRDRKLG